MKVLQIVYRDTEEIIPYKLNPRKNDAAVDPVAESIKEFGFKVPIVIDKNGTIIAGHTRAKAAKKLGMKEVPCIVADDLSEEQIKAFRLADNKVGEFAEWDFDLLDLELDDIADIDMSLFGFGDEEEELDDPAATEDDYKEGDVEPRAKLGDVWKLGDHRLMCGDSTSFSDVEKLMGGELADMCITDPPYNVDYEGKTADALKIKNDAMSPEQFREFLTQAFSNLYANVRAGGAFYIWYASREHINFETALKDAGLSVRQELIWNKNSMVLGRQDYQWKHEPCLYGWKEGASHTWCSDRTQTTVLEFDRPTRSTLHPTMKPIALFDYQIKNSSKPGDKVLDLFGGSGTTIMACEQNHRSAYVMEFDPHYVDVIIDRWEQYTGETAELIHEE